MFKKSIAVILGVVIMAALVAVPNCSSAQPASSTIIEAGKTNATIYYDAGAAEAVKRASTELQEHLQLMTGVTVPVTTDLAAAKGYIIYLGDNAFARRNGIETGKLPHDGYRILSGNNWLIIAGRDYAGPIMTGFENPYRLNESYSPQLRISYYGDAGTMFGVYHLLERYGIRWYMPGRLGTVIPKLDKITVPKLNVTKSPVYEHRNPYYGFAERSDEQTLWYRRAGFGTPAPIAVNHSFGYYFGKYKETHPEYFALIDGKRDFTNLSSAEMTGNLNLSDPGLLKQAVADIRKAFDEHPEQKIFSLGPPDGMHRISEDPVSQAQIDKTRGGNGEFSNYVWGFINKVAIEVYKTHPDRLIGCIAYSKYQLPPSNIEKFSPNVAVVICKLRATYPDPEIKQRTRNTILTWHKKASNLYVWEYYCNPLFNPGWQGYPMYFTGIIQEELKALKGVIKGDFIEAETWLEEQYRTAPDKVKINRPGLEAPLLYITARLLWDPDLNLKATLDEYYKLFYGSAQTPMRGFWELVEANWMKKGWHTSPNQVYEGDTVLKLLNFLKEAQTKAAPGSEYRERIDLILSEFSPAAEMAQRLATIGKIAAEVPKLATPQGSAAAAPLLQMMDRSYQTAAPATNFRVSWDDANLYFDVACYEPEMAKLKALATKRDSNDPPIWDDDSIEIFISADAGDPYKCNQYIINAAGALFDGKYAARGTAINQAWNGDARVTLAKEAGRWTVRLAVPWEDLDVAAPAAGRSIKANIYRSRHATGQLEQASWAPLVEGNYYSPDNFGSLTLSAKQADVAGAEPPQVIKPIGKKDFGSGPPLKGLYAEGGNIHVGLFAGQPNTSLRNDRILFRFDLGPWLEAAGRVEKAELIFFPQAIYGPEKERLIEVEHFLKPVQVLEEAAISSNEVETAGTFMASRDGTLAAANTEAKPVIIDVTELIRRDLTKGHTSTTFRWKDGKAEKDGVPRDATGFTLSPETETMPTLVITSRR